MPAIPRTILTIAVTQSEAEKILFAARNSDVAFALLTDESVVRDTRWCDCAAISTQSFVRRRPMTVIVESDEALAEEIGATYSECRDSQVKRRRWLELEDLEDVPPRARDRRGHRARQQRADGSRNAVRRQSANRASCHQRGAGAQADGEFHACLSDAVRRPRGGRGSRPRPARGGRTHEPKRWLKRCAPLSGWRGSSPHGQPDHGLLHQGRGRQVHRGDQPRGRVHGSGSARLCGRSRRSRRRRRHHVATVPDPITVRHRKPAGGHRHQWGAVPADASIRADCRCWPRPFIWKRATPCPRSR